LVLNAVKLIEDNQQSIQERLALRRQLAEEQHVTVQCARVAIQMIRRFDTVSGCFGTRPPT